MSFHIFISTTEQVVNVAGDKVQMILDFTNTLPAGNSPPPNWDAKTYGIRVEDWGAIDSSYDFEDLLLTTGTYQFTLTDAKFTLRDLFFKHTGIEKYYLRTPKVTVLLNGVTEFIGVVTEDSVRYDEGARTITMSADPNTKLLSELMLYNPALVNSWNANGAVDPLGIGNTTFTLVTTVIEKIFQKVNSHISNGHNLTISQDWVFGGENFTHVTITDGTFSELQIWNDQLFWNPANGCTTLADVLRWIAIDFSCFAGMLHNERAFFSKLFYYDPAKTQSLTVLNRSFGYRYSLIDYVEMTTTTGVVHTRGTISNIEGRTLKRTILPAFHEAVNKGSGVGAILPAWSVIQIVRGADTVPIYSAYDPVVDVLDGLRPRSIGDVIANWWYHFRHDINNCRVDTFRCSGIGYDFEKCFTDSGCKYQIVGMKKRLAKNETQIDAIYLGEA